MIVQMILRKGGKNINKKGEMLLACAKRKMDMGK